MKKIVVLDGYAMNPGDLSFAGLEALGDCTVYDFTRPEEVIPRAQDAEMVLTNKTRLTAEMIAAMPKLEYIGVLATGYNNVDIEAARQRGIVVANVPESINFPESMNYNWFNKSENIIDLETQYTIDKGLFMSG